MAISLQPEFFLREASPEAEFDFAWIVGAGRLSIGVGNKLTWPDFEGSIASSNIDANDITYPELTDAEYEIQVANKRKTAWSVSDEDRVQKFANAMAHGMSQSAREQMVNLSSVIRTAYRNSARLKATGLNAPIRGDADGLGKNLYAIEMLHSAGSGSGHPKWDTAAGRLFILKEIRRARNFFRRHGRRGRFMMIAPLEVVDQFLALITVDKVNLGSGSIVDSAFTTGQVPMIYDCEIHEDTLVAEINTAGVVNSTGGLRMDFLIPGLSVKYISQPVAVETFRDQNRFRDDGRTEYFNGAGQDAARFITSTTIQLSAS